MKYVVDTEAGTVRSQQNKKNANGQFTMQIHHGKVIGPKDDVSDESQVVQKLAEAARADYIEPPTESPDTAKGI